MNVYTTDSIRNVVLLGHGGCGKTSLVEAMAYVSGLTGRLGKVSDGTTISDYDKEEIKRKFSINTSVVPLIWKDTKINLLDTPGYFDFVGEAEEAVAAADAAVKSANVKLLGYEYAKGGGMCTVKVEGNVGACRAAIAAGKKAAEAVNGSLSGTKSTLLKARPADGMRELLVDNRETVGGEIALAEGYRPKGDTKKPVLVKNWKPKTEPKAEVVTEEAPEPPVVEEPEEEEPTSEEPETEEVKEEAPVEEPKAEEPAEETPVEETPVEEAPVEEPKAEEPAPEAPAEETPVEKAEAEEAKSEKTEPKKETDKKADAPKGKTSTGNRRSRSRRKKNTDNNDNK